MMTEEEAKTKWCPFARVSMRDAEGRTTRPRNRVVELNKQGAVAHEFSSNLVGARCIASACMAWRFGEQLCRHKERGTLHALCAMDPGMSDHASYELEPLKGYCGLAGQP